MTFPIVSEIRIRDFDTPENRIIAEAARLALTYVNVTNNNSDIASTKYWITRFKSTYNINHDLEEVNRNLRRGKYAGARGYYVKTLTLAKMILGHSGFGQGNVEEIYGDTILINSANLFEEYVRTVIANKYHTKGFSVRKGGQPPEFLYIDGSFKLTPDICILRGTQYVLIGDAKYKIPDAKDHYQMQCYIRAYGLDTGVMFSPNFLGKEPIILLRTTHDGLKIWEIQLPLADLDSTEKTLEELHDLVKFVPS